MLGTGIPWGPRRSLPATRWSSRRIAPDSWAGGSGGQHLSCPGSTPCPALAPRPTSKTFRGSLSTDRGACFHPCRQGCHNKELSIPCKQWKPRPADFPPSVTSSRTTHRPRIGLRSSVQALGETQLPGQEDDPGLPSSLSKSIHSAIIEHFLNAGATTGQVRQEPHLAMFTLAVVLPDVRINLPGQAALKSKI